MPDPDNEESPWSDHRITDSLTKDRPPELQEQRSLIRYLLFEHGGEVNSLREKKKKWAIYHSRIFKVNIHESSIFFALR